MASAWLEETPSHHRARRRVAREGRRTDSVRCLADAERSRSRGRVRLARAVTKPHVSEFRVRYSETDQMGVVYHAEYLVWCEVGRTDFIRALGLPYSELERRGTALAVAEASIRYHAPARYDDVVRVETRLVEVRSRAITFEYLIRHGESGERLATAKTLLVSLDAQGKPTPIPRDVRELMERAATS